MIHTRVRINRTGDPPSFPEDGGKKIVECNLDRVAILQGGMSSGRSSISMLIDLPDGTICWVQTSVANFMNIAAIVSGACESWGEVT